MAASGRSQPASLAAAGFGRHTQPANLRRTSGLPRVVEAVLPKHPLQAFSSSCLEVVQGLLVGREGFASLPEAKSFVGIVFHNRDGFLD
jgi:hypothetical protein